MSHFSKCSNQLANNQQSSLTNTSQFDQISHATLNGYILSLPSTHLMLKKNGDTNLIRSIEQNKAIHCDKLRQIVYEHDVWERYIGRNASFTVYVAKFTNSICYGQKKSKIVMTHATRLWPLGHQKTHSHRYYRNDRSNYGIL